MWRDYKKQLVVYPECSLPIPPGYRIYRERQDDGRLDFFVIGPDDEEIYRCRCRHQARRFCLKKENLL